MSAFYQFEMNTLKGEKIAFDQFKQQVVLVVNTASACGFTPQYKELQALYQQYQDQGFTVLAFPCNQFKQQEQGSSEDIQQFCDLNFNVSFPIFEKSDVNGERTNPVFKWLKAQAPGILGSQGIKWNFTKFLLNKNGEVVKRYAPTTKPSAIESAIKDLL